MLSKGQAFDYRRLLLLGAIFLLAFGFRFYNVAKTSDYVFDENYHATTAINYVEKGFLGPDEWFHPPLRHLSMYLSLKVFGYNPYGWRMRNVILGAATVVVLYLLSESLFGAGVVTYMSTGLLLLDPLHVATSRGSFDEIAAGFFLLCAVYFALKAAKSERDLDLFLTGAMFGLSAALKWYAFLVLFFVLVMMAFERSSRVSWKSVFRLISYLLMLPLTIYLLAYIPWFLRGNSLVSWLMMQKDAFWALERTTSEYFPSIKLLQELGSPLTWFLRPINVSIEYTHGYFFTFMNNLPVWLFFLPSMAYFLYEGVRQRRFGYLLVCAAFFSMYVPFLISSRPIFLYSSVPLLPFCFIAVAFAVDKVLGEYAYVFLAAAMAWSLFLYTFIARGAKLLI